MRSSGGVRRDADPAPVRNVKHNAIRVAELALEIHPIAAFELAVKGAAAGGDQRRGRRLAFIHAG